MFDEIERKFIITDKLKLRSRVVEKSTVLIKQGYLIAGDFVDWRIRETQGKRENLYSSCVKLGRDGLKRKEYNKSISYSMYNCLHHILMYRGDILIWKERSIIDMGNGYTGIFDDYLKDYSNLNIVEIEFDTEEEAFNFKTPDWIEREVTYDKGYKNKNLYKELNR